MAGYEAAAGQRPRLSDGKQMVRAACMSVLAFVPRFAIKPRRVSDSSNSVGPTQLEQSQVWRRVIHGSPERCYYEALRPSNSARRNHVR